MSYNWNVFVELNIVCVFLKGSEWKEKAKSVQVELQQCYKAQSRLFGQFVVEVAKSRAAKDLVQEKEHGW